MIRYITRRPLWFNILVAIAIVVILILIFILLLGVITRHGAAKTVPAVTGKNINSVTQLLSDAGFETVVQDSVFYDSLPPGIVIKQVPEADQVVKVNRTVYVWINRFVAPDASMPNVIGFSYRNAEMTLTSLGLKIGDTTHRPDFATNSVLETSFNGNPVKPGDKVKVGSKIDLVISGGLGAELISVPDLIGRTLGEAKAMLDGYGLVLGSVNPTALQANDNVYINKQSIEPKTPDGAPVRIRPGQMIDVWVQVEPVAADTTANQPPTPQNP